MNCYVCAQRDVQRAAVGLCHSCSAGLCGDHAFERAQNMTITVPLGGIVTLPVAAREILCHVCKEALDQPRRVA